MFSPSQFLWDLPCLSGLVAAVTMTSADFSRCSGRPPPVRAFSFCLYLPDLPEWVLVLLGLHKAVFVHPLIPASYPVSVRQYRPLQSRFLQCILRSKPPCGLLMFRDVTPAHKGLAPSGKITPISLLSKLNLYFWNIYRALKWVCAAHAGHTQGLCIRRVREKLETNGKLINLMDGLTRQDG